MAAYGFRYHYVSEVETTRDAPAPPDRSMPGRSTGEFGVILFLASDVMLFAAFFAAYFLLRATNSPWPPKGFDLEFSRTLMFTVVLVASSFTMITADRAHRRGDGRGMRRWLLVTIVLGLLFLGNQIEDFITMELRAGDGPYGSIFWGLTGLHAAHVTAGVCALGLLYVRAARTRALDEITPWARGISLFWHLVDVIWLGVFTTIWVIR